MQFVNKMRRDGKLIMGIGHRVKSVRDYVYFDLRIYCSLQINNPDKRVQLLKEFAQDKTRFLQPTPMLEYAIEVEKITTSKVPSLF